MTDITERLRAAHDNVLARLGHLLADEAQPYQSLHSEAADEIERLRGEVASLKFQQEEFHNVDDLVEIRKLKAERDAAVLAEREACAAICDNAERRKWTTFVEGGTCTGISAADCARAIRERGQK